MKKAAAAADETVPDYTVIVGLKNSNIAEIAEQINEKQVEAKKLKGEIDELKQAGLKLVLKSGVKSVMVDGLRVTRADGSSSKLDKKKLAGKYGTKVLAWLEWATVKTPHTTLKVTAKKEGEAEGDGSEEE